jgi:plastocyanin
MLVTGCSLPKTTRTATIHDINLEQHMVPAEITVQIGDEIRWVNHRTLPAHIDMPGLTKESLNCETGFSNMFGSVREYAEIPPGKSVHLCFARGGAFNYNMRMEAAVPGGKLVEPGVIRVGGFK